VAFGGARPEVVRHVPRRALAVYAHPDDCEVSCGGALASWASAGCRVELLVCTRGDKGSTDCVDDVERLVERRDREVADAAARLGIGAVHRLGLDDGSLENDLVLREAIVRVVRAVRPDVVVCPDPTAVFFGEHYVNHHDHRALGWAALDAVAPAASSPLYFPDAGAAWSVSTLYLSGSLDANVVVDVSGSIAQKADAVLCHGSQLGGEGEWFGMAVRERAEELGREAGLAFAETFRRVQLGPARS
jgi:LmbE family N-acetylglucosaminyl deacetylase